MFGSRNETRSRELVRAPRGGGGVSGRGVVAVVLSCQYDDITGNLYVTASRLLSVPYGYDSDPPAEDKFEDIWAGVDPLIVPDMHVVIFPIEPPPADPTVRAVAIPILSADRQQLNPPAMACLTEFGEPCSAPFDVDLCV